MAFDDDDRWERFLQFMNYLSLIEFSGSFTLNMNKGRIASSTMKQLNDAARAQRRQRETQGVTNA